MQVTIKDIAREVGVTHGVVSCVLNGSRSTIRVSAQTATRVREAAERLGYHPNAVARNFRSSRTRMIGILHGDGFPRLQFVGGSGYFGALMDGIVDGAFHYEYTVGLCPHLFSQNSGQVIADGRFDGYLWYSGGPYPDVCETIARCPFPIVVIHTPAHEIQNATPTVICDNRQGIQLALNHLQELGHQHIGFALNQGHLFAESRIRRDEFLSLSAAMGITGKVVDTAEGLAPIAAQWKRGLPFTAMIAHNEELAGSLMHLAQNLGYQIPKDLSLIGFDSTFYSELQSPKLTSIRQPLREIGRTAVTRLVQLLNAEGGIQMETLLPCSLDIRESTTFAPAK